MTRLRRHCLFLISIPTCLVFLLMTCSLQATTTEADQGIKYYEISGMTAQELMESIHKNKPFNSDGVAFTRFESNSQWVTVEEFDGSCKLKEFEFTYTLTIHMPRWTNKDNGSLCLQRNWNKVWQQLLTHENEHVRIYQLLKPSDISEKLKQLPIQKSCSALKSEVENNIGRIIRNNRLLHNAFHKIDPPRVLQGC